MVLPGIVQSLDISWHVAHIVHRPVSKGFHNTARFFPESPLLQLGEYLGSSNASTDSLYVQNLSYETLVHHLTPSDTAAASASTLDAPEGDGSETELLTTIVLTQVGAKTDSVTPRAALVMLCGKDVYGVRLCLCMCVRACA